MWRGARTDLQPTGNFPAGLPDAGRTRDAVAQAIGERIEAIERPKAEERRTANLPNQTGKLPVQEPPVRVRDAVAQAIGGMSGRTSEQALW